MEKCAILAESSAPVIQPLAALLRSRGLPCVILAEAVGAEAEPQDTVRWNPPSLLSAHTALLEADTRYGGAAVSVLAFDAEAFAKGIAYAGAGDASAAIDRLVTGWAYLAESLRETFAKRSGGFSCFVQCVPPAKGDAAVRPPLPLPVALAEAAFVRLAEETASREPGKTLLVRFENGTDEAHLEWLASRVLEGPSGRPQARWIKAGSRGLFGIL